MRRLSHSSTRSRDSTLNIFPPGLAAALPRQEARGSARGCVRGSACPSSARPPTPSGAGSGTRSVTGAPPPPARRDRAAPRARARPPAPPADLQPRSPAAPLPPRPQPGPSRSSPALRTAAPAARCVSPPRAPRRLVPAAPSRKRGSARAPCPRARPGGGSQWSPARVAGSPGNNLCPRSPGAGEVSSTVQRYARPSAGGAPAWAGRRGAFRGEPGGPGRRRCEADVAGSGRRGQPAAPARAARTLQPREAGVGVRRRPARGTATVPGACPSFRSGQGTGLELPPFQWVNLCRVTDESLGDTACAEKCTQRTCLESN